MTSKKYENTIFFHKNGNNGQVHSHRLPQLYKMESRGDQALDGVRIPLVVSVFEYYLVEGRYEMADIS